MWVDSVGLLVCRSSRSLLGLMASLLSFPSQPVTDGPAHHQFEVAALQPGQLFREQRHALTPRAGHARDVGAPEPARGAEGVVETAQVVDNFNISAFGTYYLGNTFYVDGIVTAGLNRYDQERNLSSGQPVRSH